MGKVEFGLYVVAAIVLLFMVPITLYYLGTLGGVGFSSMANDAVYMGVFLFILFIAIVALSGYMRRRR